MSLRSLLEGATRRIRARPVATRRQLAVLVGGALVVVLGWALFRDDPASSVAPSSPERVADTPLFDAQPLSVLDVPVQLDVAVLLEEVESKVPQEWVLQDLNTDEGSTAVAMAFTRGPFSASVEGELARFSATVAYALRSSVGIPLLPDMGVSCGTDDDEPAPRMDVRLETPIAVSADWTLLSKIRTTYVAPTTGQDRDRCQVTLFGVDITDRVSDGMRSALDEHAASIDSIIAAASLRPFLEEWWQLLSEPIALDSDVWLHLRPESVAQGGIRGFGATVEVVARLAARPTIVFGTRPESDPRPLPHLGTVDEGRAFEATIDVVGDYSEVGEAMTSELRGVSFEGGGQRVRVERVVVSGIGGNQVTVELTIAGDVEGTLFLVGTPDYDEDVGVVRLPDLAMTVSTSDVLVASAAWILEAGIESLLRGRVRWPVDGGVVWAADRLQAGLNARLTDGLRLRGQVGSLVVLDVLARAEGLLIRTRASGRVELLVGNR